MSITGCLRHPLFTGDLLYQSAYPRQFDNAKPVYEWSTGDKTRVNRIKRPYTMADHRIVFGVQFIQRDGPVGKLLTMKWHGRRKRKKCGSKWQHVDSKPPLARSQKTLVEDYHITHRFSEQES